MFFFFFSSRRRHTRSKRDWSSDVCSSDLDAVAEAVEEAVLHHLPGRLRQLGWIAVRGEELARDLEERAPVDARLDGCDDAVERLLAQHVPLAQLIGDLADDVGARHVGVDAGLAVLREEIEGDRLARQDRAVAAFVTDRRLRTVRDDELVGVRTMLAEDALDLGLDALRRERLAAELERPVHARAAEQLARDVERGLARTLPPAEAGKLGRGLPAAPVGEEVAVG